MMPAPLNEPLLGLRGSASRLQTPALVIDLDRFNANMQFMKEQCEAAGIGLRPHTKTHKSVEIARLQMQAGAVGVCCAKLGEAEVMAAGGIDNILITSPVVTPAAIERLMIANRNTPELLVVVDNAVNVSALASAAKQADKPLNVLLDLDPGLHRTGMQPGDAAMALAATIAESGSLVFRGLQMYAGNLMHVHGFAERRDASLAVMAELDAFRSSLPSMEKLEADLTDEDRARLKALGYVE